MIQYFKWPLESALACPVCIWRLKDSRTFSRQNNSTETLSDTLNWKQGAVNHHLGQSGWPMGAKCRLSSLLQICADSRSSSLILMKGGMYLRVRRRMASPLQPDDMTHNNQKPSRSRRAGHRLGHLSARLSLMRVDVVVVLAGWFDELVRVLARQH